MHVISNLGWERRAALTFLVTVVFLRAEWHHGPLWTLKNMFTDFQDALLFLCTPFSRCLPTQLWRLHSVIPYDRLWISSHLRIMLRNVSVLHRRAEHKLNISSICTLLATDLSVNVGLPWVPLFWFYPQLFSLVTAGICFFLPSPSVSQGLLSFSISCTRNNICWPMSIIISKRTGQL